MRCQKVFYLSIRCNYLPLVLQSLVILDLVPNRDGPLGQPGNVLSVSSDLPIGESKERVTIVGIELRWSTDSRRSRDSRMSRDCRWWRIFRGCLVCKDRRGDRVLILIRIHHH